MARRTRCRATRGCRGLLAQDLADLPGPQGAAMGGSLAWMGRGHLPCDARADGIMLRLGAGRDGWARALSGAAALVAGSRAMAGWGPIPPALAADAALRRQLLDAAIGFVASKPPKVAKPAKR